MTLNRQRPALRRALLHPAWLGAVALLAINDHLLKGSGLVPGWATGKLSDIVGLFAAPLLLAVLLRVSSRRGWVLTHLAIGLVFSAIQVSATAADAWSAIMGLFGFPWAITSDPTDLLALPALLLSAWWVPRLARAGTQHRVTEAAVATAGIAACVATSPAAGGDVFYESFQSDTYLHNANDYEIVLRIRTLSDSASIDCDLAEEDPAAYLRESLFGSASAWTLDPDATMPVLELAEREARACHAVWIDADNLRPSIVFWREGQLELSWIEGTGITPETRGWISVAYDDEGVGRYETEEDLVFAIEPIAPVEEADSCTPSGPQERLAWGSVPAGQWRIGRADEGPDGCLRLDLRTGQQQELDQEGTPWELCLPPGAFPFEVGDLVHVRRAGVTAPSEAVELTQLDPLTEERGTVLVAYRGDGSDTVLGLQPLLDPNFGCDPIVEETCGVVRQSVRVSTAGGGFETSELVEGSPTTVRSDTHTMQLHLVHASTRLMLDTECADADAGDDIEMVAIQRRRGGE